MLIRSAALWVLVCALTPMGQAGQLNSKICIEGIKERSAMTIDAYGSQLFPPILGGYDIDSYSTIIRQIAIYESVGNRDAAEILKAQLLACGVSREAVTEGVTWARINGTEPSERNDPTLHFMAPDMSW